MFHYVRNAMRTMRKIHSETSITVESEKPLSFTNVNFHESIKFFLMTAQFFGVMPLHNIERDVKKMHFKWKSIRVFYSVLNAVGAFVGVIFWLIKFGRDGLYVNKTGKSKLFNKLIINAMNGNDFDRFSRL